jgi:peptidoglycan/xylan/chitin deacetylase (PgdA/CDA1 family)
MKRLITGAALSALLLAACQTAQTQGNPQVVVVPADELSRPPSLAPATTAQPSASPAVRPETARVAAPAPVAAAKHAYNSINTSQPYVAMTFDDGPHPELTPKLLDELKKRDIRATFYVVGRNVVEYPDIVKRMVAEGHEVANHSWSHPALTKLSADGVRKQMDDTTAAIRQACGVTPVTMRPPYGATNAGLNRRLAEDYKMKVILWSVDPQDWKYRNAARVQAQILENTKPGAIILAHDIHASTIAAMPGTFDGLLAKGYKFVTVSELLAMDEPPQLVKKDAPTQ